MPSAMGDLIWIADAVKEYDRSRKWLDEKVSAGYLRYAQIEGDRRLYLLRSELDALLKPHIQRKGEGAEHVS